ncbi:hypothetical protein G7046_g7387 [Stylonectria norvegica]|nr:hypothetical protein G7046_g7387 [Stylonectria norvegica]
MAYNIAKVCIAALGFVAIADATPTGEPPVGLSVRDDTYDPSYVGSYCLGKPYELNGTPLTCPPAAYSWYLQLPGFGGHQSPNFPMTECGKGLLDNLRGRCGIISAWSCDMNDAETDIQVSFDTVIECDWFDVQDAFQAANGGTGGLWCIRAECPGTNPLQGGSGGAFAALNAIFSAAVAFGGKG